MNNETPTIKEDSSEFQTVEESAQKITEPIKSPEPESKYTGIVYAVGSLFEPARTPKLLTLIIIIGFIVIAFSNNLTWEILIYYIGFIILSGLFYFLFETLMNQKVTYSKKVFWLNLILSFILAACIYFFMRYSLKWQWYLLPLTLYLISYIIFWFERK